MSRTGKKPVSLVKGVTATVQDRVVKVKGPKGELDFTFTENVTVALQGDGLVVSPIDESKTSRALWGTTRAILANMVKGVSDGYVKNLELVGVGYRAAMQGRDLKLQLGYSHDVIYSPPPGITLASAKPTEISITGVDKQVVGQVAAEIRRYRPPEPYKGKGVKLAGEFIRRKEGKKK